VPRLSRLLAGRAGAPAAHVDVAHRVFTFPQPVKFVALEHALALEDVPEALRRLRGVLRRAGRYSPYSVLVRVGAGDDSPLSPAYGRTTGYVNLTVPRTVAFLELHRVIEQVLRELGGRPHWGKAHTATAEVLAPRYPEWSEFQRVRGELDPESRFTSDFVARVLGPVTPSQPAGRD
jgi:L-gulonolactone oxidase